MNFETTEFGAEPQVAPSPQINLKNYAYGSLALAFFLRSRILTLAGLGLLWLSNQPDQKKA